MATFVLIPGAGGDAWQWHLLVPELWARGHRALAVDLPSDDDAAGLPEYADAVVDAVRGLGADLDLGLGLGGDLDQRADRADRADLVVVASSLAGFTAPLVVGRLPVQQIVLLNAMIPTQGESAGQWWGNTGHARLDPDEDMFETFFHDVPADVRAEAIARGERPQSGTPFQRPLLMPAWPAVPTRVLLGRDDRFFPAQFQRRLARERLGITPDEMDGGHLVALSRPKELAERLDAYQR